MDNKKTGSIAVISTTIISILIVLLLDPIKQNIEYHNFTDQRTYFGIQNFWNVISNIPFLLVGVIGLYNIIYSTKIKIITSLKIVYILFFLAVSIVAIGSSYYHIRPDNASLVWDRLPMSIAFMSLLTIVISEFISPKIGKTLLWPLISTGILSVFYWHSVDDLRLYMLVQFLPVLVIPLILLFFKSTFTNTYAYWFLLLIYVIAKLVEHFDTETYNVLFFISGHSIKHVIVAFGVYLLLTSYNNRERT
ncbi:MAG: ceramidase [Gammaproteobacteria bacterium]|nr:ceramidase [Gammaproteobacteria bacterium]